MSDCMVQSAPVCLSTTGAARTSLMTVGHPLTGQKCPAEAKNDYPNIGVAFDASSRLRRAGIEWYHNELTTIPGLLM